jgi:hypothetical protein
MQLHAVDAARYRRRRMRRKVMRNFLFLGIFSLRERQKQKKKHAIAGRVHVFLRSRFIFLPPWQPTAG